MPQAGAPPKQTATFGGMIKIPLGTTTTLLVTNGITFKGTCAQSTTNPAFNMASITVASDEVGTWSRVLSGGGPARADVVRAQRAVHGGGSDRRRHPRSVLRPVHLHPARDLRGRGDGHRSHRGVGVAAGRGHAARVGRHVAVHGRRRRTRRHRDASARRPHRRPDRGRNREQLAVRRGSRHHPEQRSLHGNCLTPRARQPGRPDRPAGSRRSPGRGRDSRGPRASGGPRGRPGPRGPSALKVRRAQLARRVRRGRRARLARLARRVRRARWGRAFSADTECW